MDSPPPSFLCVLAGPRPRDQVQSGKRDVFASILAAAKLFGRLVKSLQRGVDFGELTRDTCRIRCIQLLLHRVGSEVGHVERHGRQVTSATLLIAIRILGHRPAERTLRSGALVQETPFEMFSLRC